MSKMTRFREASNIRRGYKNFSFADIPGIHIKEANAFKEARDRLKGHFTAICDPSKTPRTTILPDADPYASTVCYDSNYTMKPGLNSTGTAAWTSGNMVSGVTIKYPAHADDSTLANNTSGNLLTAYLPVPGGANWQQQPFSNATAFSLFASTNQPQHADDTLITKSRPVGMRVRVSYTGRPDQAEGTMYWSFADRAADYGTVHNSSGTFQNLFGTNNHLNNVNMVASAVGGQDNGSITLSKLCERGHIEFVLFNEFQSEDLYIAPTSLSGITNTQNGRSIFDKFYPSLYSDIAMFFFFSDITTMDPRVTFDIQYCLEVCFSRNHIHSQYPSSRTKCPPATVAPHIVKHIRQAVTDHAKEAAKKYQSVSNVERVAHDLVDKYVPASEHVAEATAAGAELGGPIGAAVAGGAAAAKEVYDVLKGLRSTSRGRPKETLRASSSAIGLAMKDKAKAQLAAKRAIELAKRRMRNRSKSGGGTGRGTNLF